MEHYEHSPSISKFSWDDWDDEEPDFGDYMPRPFEPWNRGQLGKGLINKDGEMITWGTNEMGDPHHDDVASTQDFPYVAKTMIDESGRTYIPSPDDAHLFGINRTQAERYLAARAKEQGLRFYNGFTSATKPGVCPTCGQPLQGRYGTFCPKCQWSEYDVKADDNNLSNPLDPTREMHRGIQSKHLQSRGWYF